MAGERGTEALVMVLAAGKPVTEAARLAGVSERTAWRRLNDPAVRQQVRDARAALIDHTVSRLAAASMGAAATLVALLDAESEPVRLRAAVAILEQTVKLRDSEELERRLAALEAALAREESDEPS